MRASENRNTWQIEIKPPKRGLFLCALRTNLTPSYIPATYRLASRRGLPKRLLGAEKLLKYLEISAECACNSPMIVYNEGIRERETKRKDETMKWTKVEAGTWQTTCGQWRAESMITGYGDRAWVLQENTPGGWSGVDTWATLRQCKAMVARYEAS